MGLKRIIFVLLMAMLLLPGCSRSGGDQTASPASATPTTQAEAIPSPQPSPTVPPTQTPVPTPIPPSITVQPQTLTEEGRLAFDGAYIPDGGWLAVYAEVDGQTGELLGYERLVPGENESFTITIEPRQATPSLIAQLHEDGGESGVFELPEPDVPLTMDAEPVTQRFAVDIQLPLPAIEVADQALATDGQLTVDNVFALAPGWLVVHNSGSSAVGEPLGQVPVQPGNNTDLTFSIRWRDAQTELLAVLYEDVEQPGGFDGETDLPVLDNGSAVTAAFTVSLPPDLLIYDQPVRDGKLIIERATSDQPAWIVAYYDEEDQPGRIIGSAYIEEGLNKLVELEVLESAVTQRMFLLFHEDTGTLGEFDFPANDLPLVYEGEPLPPFIMHTLPGNYLITKDQSLGEDDTIVVPVVITDLDTWLVIYNVDENGQTGEIIGRTSLPPGINRDVAVEINRDQATETLIATLHQNNDPLDEFEYPDADIPLFRNLLPIQAPIALDKVTGDTRVLP